MKQWSQWVAGMVSGIALGAAAGEFLVSPQATDPLQAEGSVLKTRLTEEQEKLLNPEHFRLPDGLEFGALVEAEAVYGRTGSEDERDMTLATVELSGGWQMVNWLRADLVLLYEENDTEPMEVDQAILTLGDIEQFPLFLQAGRMYVPFGHLDSFFISDPVVLELAEIRETAALLGFETGGFNVSLTAFSGDVETAGGSQVDNAVFSASYGLERDHFSLNTGVAWVRNIMDAEGLIGILEDTYAYTDTANDTGGLNAWATARYGAATLIAEYVAALDDIEVNGTKTGLRPDSLNLELGYTLMNRLDLAVKYERSTDVSDWFAEKRYGAVCSYLLLETDLCSTGISLEYMKEDFGSGADNADRVTAQLTIEF